MKKILGELPVTTRSKAVGPTSREGLFNIITKQGNTTRKMLPEYRKRGFEPLKLPETLRASLGDETGEEAFGIRLV